MLVCFPSFLITYLKCRLGHAYAMSMCGFWKEALMICKCLRFEFTSIASLRCSSNSIQLLPQNTLPMCLPSGLMEDKQSHIFSSTEFQRWFKRACTQKKHGKTTISEKQSGEIVCGLKNKFYCKTLLRNFSQIYFRTYFSSVNTQLQVRFWKLIPTTVWFLTPCIGNKKLDQDPKL